MAEEYQPPLGVLPKNFVHGYATASYQIEGAWNVDGRAPSVWDEACRHPGVIADGSSGDDACNSYYMTESDVALLKSYGATGYRFSISWSRLIPLGGAEDPINPKGVAYYNQLIDQLLAAGITPWITLFHWDLPLELEKRYRGWSDRRILKDWERYVRVIFETFGDRVKNWITLNEPICVVMFSSQGLKKDYTYEKDFYTISHHEILAHAIACDVYKREYKPTQKGVIGITLNCDWAEPLTDTPEAKAMAQRRLDQMLGWYADPIYRGHYPESIKKDAGDLMPSFTDDEWKLIHGSSEFFGLNSYSSVYCNGEKDEKDYFGGFTKAVRKRDGKHIGNEGSLGWLCDVPWGFGKLLAYINEKYLLPNDIPLIVTEQGFSIAGEHDLPLSKVVHDAQRINYYRGYLSEVIRAVQSGVRIEGYFAWSFIRNFEWMEGYIPDFGVTYVDIEGGKEGGYKRTPKDSARFLKGFWERAVDGREVGLSEGEVRKVAVNGEVA